MLSRPGQRGRSATPTDNAPMTTRKRRPAAPAGSVAADLYDQPGHLIRRAHQIAVAAYGAHVSRDVTPLQYAILRMVHEKPGTDQVTLARMIGLDNSTTALTAARLESKGLLRRDRVPTDRRQRRLELTPAGEAEIEALVPSVYRMRESMLEALAPEERELFMALLRKFVHINNRQSAAPQQADAE